MSGPTITAQAMTKASGVYHLIRNNQVIYVGASVDVLARVGAWHRAIPGKFDAWTIYPCDREQLIAIEREHIRRFDPPLNKAGRTRSYLPGGIHSLPRTIREHGSPQAYLRTRPALVGSSDVHAAGLNLKAPELAVMPGFPPPAAVKPHGKRRRYYWNRDEVIAWFDQREQKEAA